MSKEINEALECLEKILSYFTGEVQIETVTLSKCNLLTIKQALTQKSKKELAFDIIKKKSIDVDCLLCDGLDGYNDCMRDERVVTQEEFELLKEVL